MILSFSQMEEAVLGRKKKKVIALAGSQDPDALQAVVHAKRKGIADIILIGHGDETRELMRKLQEPEEGYRFVECEGESACAHMACELVKNGEADIPMKGLMQTASFMRAILDKERYGFIPDGGLLSQATLLEFESRFLIITDCAVNIAPDYGEKMKILKNAVGLSRTLGVEIPKAAVVCPIEGVNPKMQSTVDAAMLSKAAERGQIKNCIVDGPLAMDNALSEEAARHKGIVSKVAGKADILLVPDLCSGNILTKALVHFAKGIPSAGLLIGTRVPVVMTSRTDTPDNKYHAILTSIYQVREG